MAHGKPGNEHGSVFQFNGQWYVAYHDLYPTDYYRNTKLELIHYSASERHPPRRIRRTTASEQDPVR